MAAFRGDVSLAIFDCDLKNDNACSQSLLHPIWYSWRLSKARRESIVGLSQCSMYCTILVLSGYCFSRGLQQLLWTSTSPVSPYLSHGRRNWRDSSSQCHSSRRGGLSDERWDYNVLTSTERYCTVSEVRDSSSILRDRNSTLILFSRMTKQLSTCQDQ